uniref:Tetratricopeptide repeat protein 19 homolog, mitochondrial n=1 Tax=Cacopsylla melanoneura TaxID=428564 RepID=A0A8D8LWB6_9HEMI
MIRNIFRTFHSKLNQKHLLDILFNPSRVSNVHISKSFAQYVPRQPNVPFKMSNGRPVIDHSVLLSFGLLVMLGLEDAEEESELVTTIKRAILLMKKDEYEKAERMLHFALKMAQEVQNQEGITYVYDVMANLALTQKHYDKAEKLFTEVMKRLLSNGVKENDNKVLHISLKLAKIADEKTDYKKAQIGYEFCLSHLIKKLEGGAQDRDTLELCAMTNDWFARFYLKHEKYDEAFVHFKRAYKLCKQIHGEIHERVVQLLNDMGTISYHRGDNEKTIKYLEKAVRIGKHLPEMDELAMILINFGHVYLKLKMLDKAREYCEEGLKNAKRHKNGEGIREGKECLEELGRAIPVD